MEFPRRTPAVAAVIGGLMLALLPYLDGYYAAYELAWWVIPLLLVGGTYGLRQCCGLGRTKQRVLTAGFGCLFVAAVLNVVAILTEGSIVFLVFIGVPALIGGLALVVASASVAHSLWTRGVIPGWLALLVGLSLPVDPLFNAVVTGFLGGGLSLYGLAWIVLGGWMLIQPAAPDGERVDRHSQPQ